METINQLNDAWIASGQKVADLNAEINAALLDNSFSEDAFASLKKERDVEITRRDELKNQLEQARAEQVITMKENDIQPLNNQEKDLKAKFVKDFKAMIKGDRSVLNMIDSSNDDSGSNAGLTIPEDIQTAIHKLVRQFDSLQEYVTVEKVTTTKGSRVYEKWANITPLANLDDEKGSIGDNDDPKLLIVKYTIHRYAGINTVTNSLLKDTAENILAWLSGWIAKKVVVTRNKAIIEKMNATPSKPTITKFDDIKDLINTSVDPAIAKTSFLITNVSGFNTISKVKDADGKYMVQPVVTQPDIKQIDGKNIVVIADRWLPDVNGAHPLGYGDLKQAITLFDRENMSLLTTNIGAGAFEHDLTKIRVIDRFDVQATDADAFVMGSFKTIADQEATIKTKAE
ncbi:phage major capsid protein [Enterococcus hirae]|nr:phage major capsid protein [Enterococcus hirae]